MFEKNKIKISFEVVSEMHFWSEKKERKIYILWHHSRVIAKVKTHSRKKTKHSVRLARTS